MAIIIKSDDEIAIMREAGRIVATTLRKLVDELRPGLQVKELDKVVRREFTKAKVEPTFLGYGNPPYPATVCVSVNEEIVHGIPGKRVLQDGDVVSLDLGCTHKGFVADSALTVIVGKAKPKAQELVDVTREALAEGIRHVRAGNRLGEIRTPSRRTSSRTASGSCVNTSGTAWGDRCTRSHRCRTSGPQTGVRC